MSREKELNENIAKVLEGLNNLIELVGEDEENPRGSGCFEFDTEEFVDEMGYSYIDMSMEKTHSYINFEVMVSPKRLTSGQRAVIEVWGKYLNGGM